jgi:triosephosphate isomerase
MGRRGLVAGNWKMFGRQADAAKAKAVAEGAARWPGVDVALCPPSVLLAAMAGAAGRAIALGGQDCSEKPDGAQTGDISAAMLKDAGARFVILGHSERRRDHAESSALVCAKARAAIQAGLSPIICVGETLGEREAGRTLDVVLTQMQESAPDDVGSDAVIAYEPVWAIGTGLTPTLEQIADVHNAMRKALATRFDHAASMRLLYGGSVKATNAAEIFRVGDVDGALVGGASLDPAEFQAIVEAHPGAG